jgi:hypothetical protein
LLCRSNIIKLLRTDDSLLDKTRTKVSCCFQQSDFDFE